MHLMYYCVKNLTYCLSMLNSMLVWNFGRSQGVILDIAKVPLSSLGQNILKLK